MVNKFVLKRSGKSEGDNRRREKPETRMEDILFINGRDCFVPLGGTLNDIKIAVISVLGNGNFAGDCVGAIKAFKSSGIRQFPFKTL